MLFIHNTYNRTKLLYKNIKKELQTFPNSEAVVLFNNIDLEIDSMVCRHRYDFHMKGHKKDCLYMALEAIDIFKQQDSQDILLFSHDDVYLNNTELFAAHIQYIPNVDLIIRKLSGYSHYYMLESFILSKEGAKLIDTTIPDKLLKDKRNSLCPELTFGQKLQNIKNSFIYNIQANSYGENNLGYFHHNYKRGQGD